MARPITHLPAVPPVLVRRMCATGLAGVLVLSGCAPDAPAGQPLAFGVYVPDDGAASSDLGTVEAMAGRHPAYVLRFAAIGEPVPLDALTRIADSGSTPILTLEPWVPGQGVEQPEFAVETITQGRHDADLRRWAHELRVWGRPMLLRFAHEPNGTWYPWCVGVNGNTAADYREAWRHVRNVFRAAGVEQVSFVWTANVPFKGSTDAAETFPGLDSVDYLGLDGYNWGDADGGQWQEPGEVFDQGLATLRALPGALPILVTEVASAEGAAPGTDKARWIDDFVRGVAGSDRVIGFVWFQAVKERDWRFNSTREAEHAMRRALAGIPG